MTGISIECSKGAITKALVKMDGAGSFVGGYGGHILVSRLIAMLENLGQVGAFRQGNAGKGAWVGHTWTGNGIGMDHQGKQQ